MTSNTTTTTMSTETTEASRTQSAPARPAPIDMLDPAETCVQLGVDETALLALVNQAQLPAYRLGRQIRFRYRDVSAVASRTVAAA